MKPELRLALAMRGGVSLAVWMAGACAEIDELRRCRPRDADGDQTSPQTPAPEAGSTFWGDLVGVSPYSNVAVDVMAGASAGGLNGVLFAAAIRHGRSMSDLLTVWSKVADVDKLRRRGAPWLSLFDGDSAFLDVIEQELADFVDGGSDTCRSEQHVDLQLSATLVEPVSQPAVSPTDEALRRTRSSARFHFRHDPDAVFPHDDLDGDALARLAIAARASASFPFAFEAAVVRSSRPATFALGRTAPAIASPASERRLTDCRGVFSEARGSERGCEVGLHPDDFVVADGGIVDNIPLGKAIEAISLTPASGPTRRVLVYLHPTGPEITADGGSAHHDEPVEVVSDSSSGAGVDAQGDRRGPLAVAKGLVASRLQGQSIDDDLEAMESSNRNLRLRRQVREAVAKDLRGPDVDYLDRAQRFRALYLEQRSAVDAEEIRNLLSDPLGVLGGDPFPLAPDRRGDDRWRAPMAMWTPEQRFDFVVRVRASFNTRLESRQEIADPLASMVGLLKGGLGPLRRTGGLLLELALATEARNPEVGTRGGGASTVGSLKADLYRLNSLLVEVEQMRQIGWVVAGGNLGTAPIEAWVDATLGHLNGLLDCDTATALALCNVGAAARDIDAMAVAREAFLNNCNRKLDAMLGGHDRAGARSRGDDIDLRDVIILAMGFVADDLVTRWDQSPSPQPSEASKGQMSTDCAESDRHGGAQLVRDILASKVDAGRYDYGAKFAALEVLLLREHLLGSSAGVEMTFTRMSAAAPTIDAARFEKLHSGSARLDHRYTDRDHLLPQVKLAGNELHNFGAFLDVRWRHNDWMWGRLDAVPTLVDLLLGLDQPEACRPDRSEIANAMGLEVGDDIDSLRRQLIKLRQDQIFDDLALEMAAHTQDRGPAGEPPTRADWQIGLETLTAPGSELHATAMHDLANVAALVVGGALPTSLPRLTSPLQAVARLAAKRSARPRGWPETPSVTAPNTLGDMERSVPLRPLTQRRPAPLKQWVTLALLPMIAVLFTFAIEAVRGGGVGLVLAFAGGVATTLLPGAFLIWLGVFRRPEPGPSWRWILLVIPIVSVALIVAAVLAAAS